MSAAQPWSWLVAVLCAGVLVYLLAPVLTPFVTAALLAYMGDPLVDHLEARGRSRTLGVVLVFVLLALSLVLLLLVLVPLLEQQLRLLITRVPAAIDWIQGSVVPSLSQRLGLEAGSFGLSEVKRAVAENWQTAGGLAVGVVASVSKSGLAVLAWLGNLILVPVVTFYLLRDWDRLVARSRALLPRRVEPSVVTVVRECDEVLAEFFRGQLTLMSALAAVYVTGLWLVGLDLALLIGALAGLLSFVPYLGLLIGAGAALVAAFFQFHDLLHLLMVGAVFAVGQVLESAVLSPWLVGERVGLHPVGLIFAVLAGGQLFGFLGVLLAVPVAAVVAVMLRHLYARYQASELYGS